MKALIIEDEHRAAARLKRLISNLDTTIEVVDIIDSVEDAVNWFKLNSQPNLLFLDIHLADGLSFNIFEKVKIDCPIIFTTAYDDYALIAFKLNSIDYLLKPIDEEELKNAIEKFRNLSSNSTLDINSVILALQKERGENQYKQRFLVKLGEQLKHVPVEKVAYFYFDEGYTYLATIDGKKLVVDYSLDQVSGLLNPKSFFRISRKVILHHQSISQIHTWFNSRLKLELTPNSKFEVLVSRDRVSEFKSWLDQ